MTDLSPPGSFQASATAINNLGEIVGGYALESGGGGAFLYSSGAKQLNFPYPAGSSAVSAFALSIKQLLARNLN